MCVFLFRRRAPACASSRNPVLRDDTKAATRTAAPPHRTCRPARCGSRSHCR
ncbi:hypothetical protein GCM10018793_32060 [Streptomyces sulfonofaciens]|uniref:Uncharacterized protein n=1 Tax=Streptomyces sulfonofaciens TaxID=68272 RepID=A0A919L0C9_9ACTN|nr:hypothetical protein GCM10018793_32060 [Streptomyces sulfonofaciens]